MSEQSARERCNLLSRSSIPTVEPIGFSLIDSSGCSGFENATVVSCTYTSQEDTIKQFVDWVSTSPLEELPNTCASMRVARSARVVIDMTPSPPSPPSPPDPPHPPPRPLPSPPPPPPSPPPSPPDPPHPPQSPPTLPPSPPAPPEDPPFPPSPPSTVQIASQPLCHPTCVSFRPPPQVEYAMSVPLSYFT